MKKTFVVVVEVSTFREDVPAMAVQDAAFEGVRQGLNGEIRVHASDCPLTFEEAVHAAECINAPDDPRFIRAVRRAGKVDWETVAGVKAPRS